MSNKKSGGWQHFVPQFYLRQWAEADEKLWQYAFDGRSPIRRHVREVAFERGLYTHPAPCALFLAILAILNLPIRSRRGEGLL